MTPSKNLLKKLQGFSNKTIGTCLIITWFAMEEIQGAHWFLLMMDWRVRGKLTMWIILEFKRQFYDGKQSWPKRSPIWTVRCIVKEPNWSLGSSRGIYQGTVVILRGYFEGSAGKQGLGKGEDLCLRVGGVPSRWVRKCRHLPSLLMTCVQSPEPTRQERASSYKLSPHINSDMHTTCIHV